VFFFFPGLGNQHPLPLPYRYESRGWEKALPPSAGLQRVNCAAFFPPNAVETLYLRAGEKKTPPPGYWKRWSRSSFFFSSKLQPPLLSSPLPYRPVFAPLHDFLDRKEGRWKPSPPSPLRKLAEDKETRPCLPLFRSATGKNAVLCRGGGPLFSPPKNVDKTLDTAFLFFKSRLKNRSFLKRV